MAAVGERPAIRFAANAEGESADRRRSACAALVAAPTPDAATRSARGRQPIDERLRAGRTAACRGDRLVYDARRSVHVLDGAAARETRRLDRLHHAWAGGTSIGACLADFLRRFGDRMVGRDTVVMIASDGLDVGEPEMLRDAMRDLHRRSAGVVWLNPLLETPGYEPTASGMRAARPYISTFAAVTDAASLARLSRIVHLRT